MGKEKGGQADESLMMRMKNAPEYKPLPYIPISDEYKKLTKKTTQVYSSNHSRSSYKSSAPSPNDEEGFPHILETGMNFLNLVEMDVHVCNELTEIVTVSMMDLTVMNPGIRNVKMVRTIRVTIVGLNTSAMKHPLSPNPRFL